MATTSHKWLTVYVIFSSIISPFEVISAQKTHPTLAKVEEWSQKLDTYLESHISSLTGYYTLQPSYREHFSMSPGQDLDVNVKFETIQLETLVNEMASDLSEMLRRKMKALENSVRKAEAAAANHTWDPNLNRENVYYKNAKDMTDEILTHDDRFGQKVNFSYSSVHIPVEIYDGDLEILNGLNWTSQLDGVFEENYRNDPEILWQYFGSQAGFMRTYPGSAWVTRGPVDLYDVRRQSWYTQGSSSPKDMMILIDTSGSTHGQALQLMKVAVKSILDTLGENDFVNIAKFSTQASFVSPCFNHTPFVLANYRNKQRLSNDVNNLEATGMANFKAGLEFAFRQFGLRNDSYDEPDRQYGANCNKVIMMLTDGGTDNAEEIFKEFNWPNKTVRVFTYAVGPTANPTNAIRWMACANRGYFSPIPAMGAIRTRVQEYVDVLVRPLAIQHIEHAQWSSRHASPFVDATNTADYTRALVGPKEFHQSQGFSWELTTNPYVREYIPVLSRPQVLQDARHFVWGSIYYDHLGLGMMTTVTLPVYNRTSGSSNQTILGVMGIDVTTADMMKKSPKQQLGPNGYSFAVNPNGYIIFHPNLKATDYMRDPPNVDLLEIEMATDKKNDLRNAMIRRERGNTMMNTFVLSPDMNYVYKDNLTYSYRPIDDTSFSLGMSLPSFQSMYPSFNGRKDRFDFEHMKAQHWDMLVAPWDFYLNMSKQGENLTGTIQDLLDILESDPDSVEWDLDQLYHLYWDAKIVSKVKDYFEVVAGGIVKVSDSNGQASDVEGHILSFITTNGGLTTVFPPNESTSFMNYRDTLTADYYKRILSTDKQVFFVDPLSKAGTVGNMTYAPDITVGRAITIQNNGKTVYKPAAAGARLTNKKLTDIFMEKASDMNYHGCDDPDVTTCYLLDDGAFVIATNQEELNMQVGQFLGKVDLAVMWKLLNTSVYERLKYYDYQMIHDCTEEEPEVSAGFPSVRIPSINLLFDVLSVNWWTSKFAWVYFNFNFWNSLFSSQEVYADDEADNGIIESCVEVMYQHYYGTEFRLSDTIECENCTRKVYASRLSSNTNLLLVVVDPQCTECENYFEPLPQEAIKVSEEEEEEVVCEMAMYPRYRQPITECYSKDPREDASKCLGLTHNPSVMSVLLSLAIIAISVQCLTANS